jgi:hypothetical protein
MLKRYGGIFVKIYATITFKHNFKKAKVHNIDIATFKNEEIDKEYGDVDVIVGGPPCQGFSTVGKSEVAFQTKYFVQKELDIRGSRNAMPEDFRAVIHYIQNGNCPMNELISAVVQPEEAGEALQKWSENPGKVFRMLVEF